MPNDVDPTEMQIKSFEIWKIYKFFFVSYKFRQLGQFIPFKKLN